MSEDQNTESAEPKHAADPQEDHATPNNGNPQPENDSEPSVAGSQEREATSSDNGGETVDRSEPHSGDPDSDSDTETTIETPGGTTVTESPAESSSE